MNVTDPVCKKELDLCDAFAFEDHEGWAYFLCSAECHKAFNRSPERFAERPIKDSGNPAGLPTASLWTAT